jgi:hypothetical protein
MKFSSPSVLLALMLAAGLTACGNQGDGGTTSGTRSESTDQPVQQGDDTIDAGPGMDDGGITDNEVDGIDQDETDNNGGPAGGTGGGMDGGGTGTEGGSGGSGGGSGGS